VERCRWSVRHSISGLILEVVFEYPLTGLLQSWVHLGSTQQSASRARNDGPRILAGMVSPVSLLRLCLGMLLVAAVSAECLSLRAAAQASGPTTENGALERAARLEEHGQFAQAEKIYLEQEEHFPKNADILFHLGTLRMRQSAWPEAIKYLEKCRMLQPRNADVLFYLAQAYYLNRELLEAQKAIIEAARVAPKNSAVLQKAGEYLCDGGDCGPGLEDLLKARKLDPELENIDLDLGMAYFKLAHNEEAQPILETVFRNDPNNLVAALILGKIAAREGNWEKARGFAEYVLARQPRNASALNDQGTALVALGKDEEALAPLRQALEINPGLFDAHFQLGRALRNLGRSDDALHEMELFQSIRDREHIGQTLISPDKALQNEHWKECEKLLNENGESAAIAYVNSLAAQTHTQLSALYIVGMLYSALQRNEDAIRLLSKATQVSPNEADIVAFLGRVYLRVHNYKQSEVDLKLALKMSPQNQIALVGIGEMQYMRGQWAEAARYFDESHTQEVSTLLLMCDAYARAGNREKAREAAALVRAFANGDTRTLEELNSYGCKSDAVQPQQSARSPQ
jgi:tetratricopeptide (TPR) repeat protein